MYQKEIKRQLFKKLKDGHYFWSYDVSSVNDISDELLIEMVMIYLDIDEINQLFFIYPYQKVKSVWIEKLIPQGEYLFTLNKFLALYYFQAKNPGAYVKSMATRQRKRGV